jgi:hypothetical protein
MNSLPDEMCRMIWSFLYPVQQLNNRLINNSVNYILKKSDYCKMCGKNNECYKCEFCNDVYYFCCNNCKHIYGNNLVCCTEFYEKYGILN